MRGYAAKHHGQIDMKTVSATERAAKVNWLYTNGIMVLNSHTDEQIELMFRAIAQTTNNVTIIPVEVSEIQ